MRKVLPLGLLVGLIACASGPQRSPTRVSSEPTIVIAGGGQERRFTRAQLLESPRRKKVSVTNDPAYGGKAMVYEAVPLAELFEGLQIEETQTLVFHCLDGFSGPISAKRALNPDRTQSVAYLAIEPEAGTWPPLKVGQKTSAGPFYLVWENPSASKIRIEEWPFQLAGFTISASLEKEFPGTVPDEKLPKNSQVRRGYALFAQNCFACHTMNGQGRSQLGPDLNIPFSPTEYFKPAYLRTLIRNPQKLRTWPQSKMMGFDPASLSDKEMSDIIAYLSHMSGKKIQ